MESGSKIKEYLAVFTGSLAAFTAGICITWTHEAFPKLYGTNWSIESPLRYQIAAEEVGWISVTLPMEVALCSLFSGFIADKIGRIYTLILSGGLFIVGFFLLAIASNLTMIYIARICWSVAIGPVFVVLPMYIGEIASPKIRGTLGCLMYLCFTISLLWSAAIAPYVSWAVYNYINIAIPLIFVVIFFCMPESPYHLLAKGDEEAACNALMFLRSKAYASVQREIEQIKHSINESRKHNVGLFGLFSTFENHKAMFISLALVTFLQLSGFKLLILFSMQFFPYIGLENSKLNNIILALIQTVAAAITPFIIDRVGRKILLIISAVGMSLINFILWLYINLKEVGYGYPSHPWFPCLCLILFICAFYIGFGPVPWVILSEIFPLGVKSMGLSISVAFNWLLNFIVLKYMPLPLIVKDDVNSITFKISIWFCVLAVLFAVYLPETKCKTLDEIQMILEKSKRKNNNSPPSDNLIV